LIPVNSIVAIRRSQSRTYKLQTDFPKENAKDIASRYRGSKTSIKEGAREG